MEYANGPVLLSLASAMTLIASDVRPEICATVSGASVSTSASSSLKSSPEIISAPVSVLKSLTLR